ncbi:MAG: hypothetical protein ACPGWR_02645 [Ardenticatenaceae bacterium]
MEDILKALLGGASDRSGEQQQQPANSNQAMIDLLGSVLGGGGASQGQSQPSQYGQANENPIADLIGGILGGGGAAQPQQRAAQENENPIADLIGGILGGGGAAQPQGRAAQPSDNPIGDLISGFLGGGNQQGSGNIMADMLQGIMGGSNAQRMNPFSQILVDKLGLSPAIAQVVVTYFMTKIIGMVSNQGMGAQPQLPQGSPQGAMPQGATPQGGGLDLDHLLSNVDDEESLNIQLSQSGMPQELSNMAGIDEDTATRSLQELVKVVGQQRATGQSSTSEPGALDNLLDSW